ncbi:hypothetical protein [Rossellomorea sp. NPDC077527]|uniref:hypothetical protein n=1 Tax=Rossellomorea sp. NPDC077527 TaxID=3364510 RepID=UPI0037C62D67
MKKRKKPTNGKVIDCKIDLPPRGCQGIFPFKGCKNPTIQLDDIGIISCKGIISGRVLCDFQPLQGVTVTLTPSPMGLLDFDDMTPVTDSTGRFSTKVTVAPGTPITPNVEVTATAVVIGKTISDSIYVRVDCIKCKNPDLSLDPIPCPVGCKGTKIRGRLLCDGLAIGNAAITFIIESDSNRVVITPNPAITQSDGRYTATLVPFPDVNETIRITAVTKIGGKKVCSETREVVVRCVKCKNPAIKLKKLKKIDCHATVSGKVTCDGVPLAHIPVTLTGSPILTFQTPHPITDEDGRFSSVVTVKKGTPFQTASYTATAEIEGKTISDSDTVIAGCKKCRKPKLTLEVPCETVTCEGAKLFGRLTCDGKPIQRARISFTVISSTPDGVEVDPNPAFTDEDGRYVTMIRPQLGVQETIIIKAKATVEGEQVVASGEVAIDCRCKHPKIDIQKIKKLNCKGIIAGYLSCEGVPLANQEVTLSSPVITFKPDIVVTDENGEFSTLAFVPPNTPFKEVPFTATAMVDGIAVSEMVFILAGCRICEKPELTLCIPDCIECCGAPITGKFTCNGKAVAGVDIKLKITPDVGTITPDGMKTNNNGEYEAKLIPHSHVSEEAEIRATAEIKGMEMATEMKKVKIRCTCLHPTVKLDKIDRIDCCGKVKGEVSCDGMPLADVEVVLNSPILQFSERVVKTDGNGRFLSEASVPPNTIFQDVPYFASALVEGTMISDKAFVWAGCEICRKPELTLCAPDMVECDGACITGKVICDESPLENVEVFFEVLEEQLKQIIKPNPAMTGKDGEYSTEINTKQGMNESITVRAFILWEGKKIVSKPYCINLNCLCDE